VSDDSTAILQRQLERAVVRLANLRSLQKKRVDAYKTTSLTDERTAHDLWWYAACTPALCPTGTSWTS
jgi:hypothetical protein